MISCWFQVRNSMTSHAKNGFYSSHYTFTSDWFVLKTELIADFPSFSLIEIWLQSTILRNMIKIRTYRLSSMDRKKVWVDVIKKDDIDSFRSICHSSTQTPTIETQSSIKKILWNHVKTSFLREASRMFAGVLPVNNQKLSVSEIR